MHVTRNVRQSHLWWDIPQYYENWLSVSNFTWSRYTQSGSRQVQPLGQKGKTFPNQLLMLHWWTSAENLTIHLHCWINIFKYWVLNLKQQQKTQQKNLNNHNYTLKLQLYTDNVFLSVQRITLHAACPSYLIFHQRKKAEGNNMHT